MTKKKYQYYECEGCASKCIVRVRLQDDPEDNLQEPTDCPFGDGEGHIKDANWRILPNDLAR